MTTDGFIKILDSIDSTNNYAMAMVREGLANHGTAVIAKNQTKGKGQRGNTWQMKAGEGIALSVILKADKLKLQHQFCLSMAVALGVIDFFKNYTSEEIKIKWPNDLYWRDRKAGGVLIETVFTGMKLNWAVIGIGINISQEKFNKTLPNPVSLHQITGRNYDVIELARQLYKNVMHRMENGVNIKETKLFKEYNKNLYQLNQQVKLKKANAVFNTTIKGVSLQGELLTADTMERHFGFGEVEWLL